MHVYVGGGRREVRVHVWVCTNLQGERDIRLEREYSKRGKRKGTLSIAREAREREHIL